MSSNKLTQRLFEGFPRALKLLPLAALLAASFAPQAWAANTGGGWSSGTGYYVGTNYGATGPENNTVTIDEVTGGAAGGEGGEVALNLGDWVTANNNTLTIQNGGKVGVAYGGTLDWSSSGATNPLSANGNTVTIEQGGEVTGNVFGGDINNIGTMSSTATNNKVILAGGTVGGDVMGGNSSIATDDVLTDNTLALKADALTLPMPAVGGNVGNFAKLEFTLPASLKNGDVVLPVTGSAIFPAPVTEITLTNPEVFAGAAFNDGDEVALIDAAGGLTIEVPANLKAKAITVGDYTLSLSATATQLIAKISKASTPAPTPTPNPTPAPGSCGADTLDPGPCGNSSDNSSPAMGELGLLLSGLALAGAAAPALRRRERKAHKQD